MNRQLEEYMIPEEVEHVEWIGLRYVVRKKREEKRRETIS